MTSFFFQGFVLMNVMVVISWRWGSLIRAVEGGDWGTNCKCQTSRNDFSRASLG